jgi:hypothetical protein
MTAKRLITGILSLLVIAAVMAPSLMAQSLISGDMTGTVTDPSGAVVSGATVTLKSDSTGATRTTTTGSNGTFRFSLLSPGNYTITVTAGNFSKAEEKAAVNVGQATIADVKLSVGAASQTVEVTSAVPLVQTDNADLSTNFSQSLIQNSPNGGNDITYVAQTAPGVTMNVGQGYGNFTAYGLPATSNLFTVNGENDMDPYLNLNNSGATNLTLGRNEVQEATVISNAYSGQYGQQAGAQVNYVTKSGTNNYHGDLAYWWTGSSLDANDWFNTCGAACGTALSPRPFANNNEWAASIGGPIKKDKLFFFLNNEGIRYIVPSTTQVFAPTPAFMAATLSNLATGAFNPAVGLGPADTAAIPAYTTYFNLFSHAPGYVPNNYVPGSCFGAANGISLGPSGLGVPGLTEDNCITRYQASPALPGTEFIASLRLDYNLSDKDHLWWRGRVDQGTQDTYADPISPAFNAASYQPAYDGQGQWNHVFSPNATNQFVYAGSYYRAIFTQNSCCAGFPYEVNGAAFGTQLTTVGGAAVSFPQGRNVTQYQFVDDFSLSRGVHNLKFGANFRRYDITDYTFTTYTNPLVALLGIDDLFFDSTYRFQKRYPLRATEPVALWGLGVYGQDEWRVSKALKLTLALRAEKNSNPVCQTNCASLLTTSFSTLANDPSSGLASPATPFNQLVVANRHQVFRDTDTINFAPRFGFAWSPGGNDKTVIRGGIGIFYDALPAYIGDAFMANLPNRVEERPAFGYYGSTGLGWADPGALTATAACADAIQGGFASGVSWNDVKVVNGVGCRKPSFNTQAGTFHTPYWEQWSIGLQQALGDKSAVGLTYVGNHGVRIPILNEGLNAYNAAGLFGPELPTAPLAGDFGVVQEYRSSAVSNYNGITANFNQRITYGFTVTASYTWSHTLDEVSNAGGEPYNGITSLQYQFNPYCLKCQYGNADYDIRNSFNATVVWQTPWKFGNKFANGAVGGWTLGMNFFARSGLPYTIVDGFDAISNYGPTLPVASINQFAQNACSNGLSQCVPFQDPTGTVINPVYNIPGLTGTPLSTFTNQRRNQYRGPGFFDSDLSVNKNFKLTERMAFGVGANLYNVFNHPNFTNPDQYLGDSTFGQILQTTAPPTGPYGSFFTGLPSGRIVQFQGKLVF